MNQFLQQSLFRLLFPAMILVMGLAGLVSARNKERSFITKLCLQGVLMAVVIAAACFPGRTELKLGSLLIVALLVIQSIWEWAIKNDPTPAETKQVIR